MKYNNYRTKPNAVLTSSWKITLAHHIEREKYMRKQRNGGCYCSIQLPPVLQNTLLVFVCIHFIQAWSICFFAGYLSTSKNKPPPINPPQRTKKQECKTLTILRANTITVENVYVTIVKSCEYIHLGMTILHRPKAFEIFSLWSPNEFVEISLKKFKSQVPRKLIQIPGGFFQIFLYLFLISRVVMGKWEFPLATRKRRATIWQITLTS